MEWDVDLLRADCSLAGKRWRTYFIGKERGLWREALKL